MTATDPVQAVAEALAMMYDHEVMWGSGAGDPDTWLDEAAVLVAAARPAIAAEAKAAALRDAAEAVLPAPHPNRCLAFSCVECARRYERDRLRDWLRDRADRIEADDDRT